MGWGGDRDVSFFNIRGKYLKVKAEPTNVKIVALGNFRNSHKVGLQ